MNKILMTALLLFGFTPLTIAADNNDLAYGIELDALPYLTGGYYLSGWVGKDQLRIRAITAKVNIPKFATQSGFEDNKLNALALVVDYFPNKNLSGIWYGGGLELWDSEIKAEGESAVAKYNNLVLTAGGGYVWYVSENIYINPWGTIHATIGGDKTVNVGSKEFKPRQITGEVSLKIGFKF